ncbi:hypothetical protein GFB56_12495 [Ensifer sp. T173]|uniref:Uncharacterized protein n=1 Tax=Ensifer canadensis TaxID=555315 RepID=A0AAW4FHR0_9HYPH|nr:hypothetical protein [Ensifer canadensis]MBM3091632.1 hypothetical protein [Ensifer canadensis]UBI74380.1 hypothetical protein J3R84_12855 [Ensifer canadensis]
MTAKALIKQAELQRLADVANRHVITIEVETAHYKLRMIPNSVHTPQPADDVVSPTRNPLDIPLSEHPPEPIQPPFDHREKRAMDYLMTVGPDKAIDWYTLKNFGRHTQRKLQERGYIDVSAETDRQGNPDQVWLTKAGQKAMRALDAHRTKYPVL